jgi:hypothetical protein
MQPCVAVRDTYRCADCPGGGAGSGGAAAAGAADSADRRAGLFARMKGLG